MKNLLIITLCLILPACGAMDPKDPRTIHGIDPAFYSYVGLYLDKKPSHTLDYDISIGFGPMNNPNELGFCRYWTSSSYRQINIDKFKWNQLSERRKKSLIAHELGHCDLNRPHSPDRTSMMYYQNIGVINFRELFNPKTEHASVK